MRTLIITEEERKRILTLYDIPYKDILMTEGLLKGMSFDDFMEQYREKLFSPAGMAIETFLTSFAITAPAVVVSYSALLTYDIYKSVQDGVTNWFNIICDTLCVISSGTLGKIISPLLKYKNAFTKAEDVLLWFKNSKLWTTIEPWLRKIANGVGFIADKVGQGISWLANKTGITFLINVSGKIISFLNSIVKIVFDFIGNVTSKVVAKTGLNQTVSKAAGSSAKTYTGTKGLEYGIDRFSNKSPYTDIRSIVPSETATKAGMSIDFANIQ